MIQTSKGKISVELFRRLERIDRDLGKVVDEIRKPTIEMLRAMVAILGDEFGRPFTATEAYQVWVAVFRLQWQWAQKHQTAIEVSFTYGIDATKLSDSEIVAYHARIPQMNARKRIQEGRYNPSDFEGVFNLYMIAFNDEELALKARANAIRANMNSKK